MEKYIPRLKEQYNKEFKDQLYKELKLKNVMEIPTLKKIVINTGLNTDNTDKTDIEALTQDLAMLSGQKPVLTKAKKAISGFKLRKGDVVGLTVTLRGNRMWEFLDKIVNVVFPRTKDFRGISSKSFDGNGNYTIGIKEHTVFPEVDSNAVTKLRGMEVTLVISTNKDEYAKAFLLKFGFPFNNDGKKI
ncbi:50S ribosomal protein L5 [Candidatus Dojkabacteria bacterium]|nr:50S ribosomal protein L5 [Candidatus Dojkabacteria bacterium]